MEYITDQDTSILNACEKVRSDPPSYKTEHYIVEASEDCIAKAVGWARYIESNVYSTLLEMMGHTPTVNIHVLHFVDHRLRGSTGSGAWFEKITRFRDTEYVGSRIKIFKGKLHDMPPYRAEGDITHETIHGLLEEAKNQKASWKPIWHRELLDNIFEIELSKRLGNGDGCRKRYLKCIKKAQNYAVFAEFWKEYGWQPFQRLIVRLHDEANFHPTFDQNAFVYNISLSAKQDVSPFFEQRGWRISDLTRQGIVENLKSGSSR